MVNLEGKLKDEKLMSRIAEAERSQLVAELRQQIASMECQNQEFATLDNLVSLDSIDDNSDDEEDVSSGADKNVSMMSTSTSSLKLDSPHL